MYGFLRGLLPTLEAARTNGQPWVYVDRGYFRATYGDDYRGYFRMTRGAFQHSGAGDYDRKRWDRLTIKMAPWRRGRHILLCPPGEVFSNAVGGFGADKWLGEVLATLKANSDRPVRVRRKPRPGDASKMATLQEDLQDCHALVTYMSNTATEAVLAGVPVFCSARSAAGIMGRQDFAQIEHPVYPEREGWAYALAANQWTLDELAHGAANHLFQ